MDDRYLKAFEKLKTKLDSLEKEFTEYKKEHNVEDFKKLAEEMMKYRIKDGRWYYGDLDIDEPAIGPRGPKGDPLIFDDLTPEQIVLLTGADGRDGKDLTFDDLTPEQIVLLTGADGLPGEKGKDGKDGKDGLPGKDGKDGKDGETPEFEIGEVKSVSTYDPAKVLIRKKGKKYFLDMDIPRGRPGSNGIDGSNGAAALINGMNSVELVAGDNIELEMIDNKIIISATGGGPSTKNRLITSDNKIFLTSDNENFIVKESE